MVYIPSKLLKRGSSRASNYPKNELLMQTISAPSRVDELII